MRAQPTRTWDDAWNDVIQTVIFADEQLKSLMMIPENTDILTFIKKYFVQAAYNNGPLINEDVVINYSDMPSTVKTRNISQALIQFDIYVKDEFLYGISNEVGADVLKQRHIAIANRLRYLLMRQRFTCGIKFQVESDYSLGTRTIGYKRWHIVFSYPKIYL